MQRLLCGEIWRFLFADLSTETGDLRAPGNGLVFGGDLRGGSSKRGEDPAKGANYAKPLDTRQGRRTNFYSEIRRNTIRAFRYFLDSLNKHLHQDNILPKNLESCVICFTPLHFIFLISFISETK